MIVLRILIDVLIVGGLVFALAGTLGVLKMPDTFSRMQASTCITTMGVLGAGIGGALYAAFFLHSAATTVKVIVIVLLVLTINPVGAHAIAKGAYRHGIHPEMKADHFRRDFHE